MKPLTISFVCLAILLSQSPVEAAPQPLRTASYMGYNPQTGQNNLEYNIIYRFPDPTKFGFGPYPLFVWTGATFTFFRDPLALTFIAAMNARGFVAASLQYSNFNFAQICPEYLGRAGGMFDAARASSAVGVLCALTGVACGQGIVTSGMSQGGAMAILARNFAPNVRATYAISISDFNKTGIGLSLPCLSEVNTALPANRLTIVNGENDAIFGGQAAIMRTSGIECPIGTIQCWSSDGSGAGWYQVQNSQVEDGHADHCYIVVGDCADAPYLDVHWYFESRFNWSLKPNLDWLATMGTSRVFSPSGQ